MDNFSIVKKSLAVFIAALIPTASVAATIAKTPANVAPATAIVQQADEKQTAFNFTDADKFVNESAKAAHTSKAAKTVETAKEAAKAEAGKTKAAGKVFTAQAAENANAPILPAEIVNAIEAAPAAEVAISAPLAQEAQATVNEAPATNEAQTNAKKAPSAEEAKKREKLTLAAKETKNEAKETEKAAAEAPAAEQDNEIEAVETWDISNSDNDNVKMTYYDSKDVEAILKQLTGCIKSLFVPMTAYAADVTVIRNDVSATGIDDDDDLDATTPQYTEGTVVISGEGEMRPNVYNNFVSTRSYVNAAESALSEYYGVTVKGVYDETITDIIELDRNVAWYVEEGNDQYPTGTQVYITEELRSEINAGSFLDYSPMTIIFYGDVTNISDFAFIFCAGLEEVILPDTIESIGNWAFAYCTGLKTLELNEGLQTIGESAFYQCRSLEEVIIPASVETVGCDAFKGWANNSYITCGNDKIYKLISGYRRNSFKSSWTEVIPPED